MYILLCIPRCKFNKKPFPMVSIIRERRHEKTVESCNGRCWRIRRIQAQCDEEFEAFQSAGGNLYGAERIYLKQPFKTEVEKPKVVNNIHTGYILKKRLWIIRLILWIKKRIFGETLAISDMLLRDEHDLIHKAVGWMLREVGKRNVEVLEIFLKDRYKTMPRTMLRYAIEKFPEDKRKKYLKGEI